MSHGPALLLPAVIGHRGAADIAPENTLAGIRVAAEAGARWVEIDARLSADGVPVLSHDASLERMGGVRRRISRLTAAELSRIPVAGGFGADYATETVPTLERLLAEAHRLGLGVNVELKAGMGRQQEFAHAIAKVLSAARRTGGPPVLVSSFRHTLLGRLRVIAPDIPTGLLMRAPRKSWRMTARKLGCAALIVRVDRVTADDIAALVQSGLPVAVFTVTDAAVAKRLFEQGVKSVFSGNPGPLIAALPSQ